MNCKKIIISASTYPDGDNIASPEFVKELAARLSGYFSVDILAPSNPRSKKLMESKNVKVYRYRYFLKRLELLCYKNAIMENIRQRKYLVLLIPLLIFSQTIHLLVLAKKYNHVLINAHWIIPQGLVAVLCNKLFFSNKINILITAHGGDIYSLPSLNWLKKWVLVNAKHTFIVSNAASNYCKDQILKNSKASTSVLPMGIDFSDRFLRRPEIEREKELIFVGRLAEKKGVNILIQAIAILKKQNIHTKLSIIGYGSMEEPLKLMARELGIKSQIDFIGGLQNESIPHILNQHKIFVFPSVITKSGDREGLGLSAIEAMGCECLVISSDLETSNDFITHKKTGLLFKTGDAQDLSDKIKYALQNDNITRGLSLNGRKFVKDQYSWERITKEYIKKISNL